MCNPKSTREQRSIALLPLGQIVATPSALALLDQYAINAMDLIKRHQSGDWGNVKWSPATVQPESRIKLCYC